MRHLLIAAALLAVPLTLPTTAAHAASYCWGKVATIEVTSGSVTGTPGRDVIVVSGTVTSVESGGGRDLICVGDHSGSMSVGTGSGNDLLDVSGGPVSLDAGADDDELFLDQTSAGSEISLGTGHDELTLHAPDRRVRADLQRHVLQVDGRVGSLHHAEDLFVDARRAVLRGDGDDNDFLVYACSIQLAGAGGDDVLRVGQQDNHACLYQARMSGGPGDDSLQGGKGDDTLTGGPGQDLASGAGGTDRCVAEVVRTCER
jgi:serralysin